MRSKIFRKAPAIARAAALALPLVGAACKSPFEGACTLNFVYGISATATDVTTSTDITRGAFLIATEGAYRDSVGAPFGFLAAAGERAGTYTVTIGHPGYSSFTQTNVVVNKDVCHVIPVKLEARLLRNP